MAKIDTISFDMILEQILTYTDIGRLLEIPRVKAAVHDSSNRKILKENKNLMDIPELYPVLCVHFKEDVCAIWENTWKHIEILGNSAGAVQYNN